MVMHTAAVNGLISLHKDLPLTQRHHVEAGQRGMVGPAVDYVDAVESQACAQVWHACQRQLANV